MDEILVPHTDIKLTEREVLVAQIAAKIAQQQVAADFYQKVGKSVVTRVLVWIGMLVVGFGAAHGWIKFGQ